MLTLYGPSKGEFSFTVDVVSQAWADATKHPIEPVEEPLSCIAEFRVVRKKKRSRVIRNLLSAAGLQQVDFEDIAPTLDLGDASKGVLPLWEFLAKQLLVTDRVQVTEVQNFSLDTCQVDYTVVNCGMVVESLGLVCYSFKPKH